MRAHFERKVNDLNEVRWTCKVDGQWITGDSASLSHNSLGKASEANTPAVCKMRDFVDFIEYISTNDLRDSWTSR